MLLSMRAACNKCIQHKNECSFDERHLAKTTRRHPRDMLDKELRHARCANFVSCSSMIFRADVGIFLNHSHECLQTRRLKHGPSTNSGRHALLLSACMALTLPVSHFRRGAGSSFPLLQSPDGFEAITPPRLLVTSLTLSWCASPTFFLTRSAGDEDTDSDVTDDGGRIADDDADDV